MEIRKTLLPHDLQYLLDGASEHGGITGAADIAVRLYGSAERLDAIGNAGRPRRGSGFRAGLRSMELDIERYGVEIIRELPAPRRMALLERGMLSLIHEVGSEAEWMAQWHYEDETKGGCARPFLKQWRLTRDMLPTPKLARRLRSPAAIRRYIHDEGSDINHCRALFEIISTIPQGATPTDADRQALFEDLDGQLDSHRKAQRLAIEEARWQAQIQARELPPEVQEFADQVLVRLKPGILQRRRKVAKERRRATKRAAMLAAAVLGASTVSAFARGEQVLLPGTDVGLSARLTRGIGSTGHGAIQVGVHDTQGTRLAKLCVFQEAPALDQLVSLAMHVRAGCVDQVLDTGNLYAIEPAADAHPVITSRAPRRPVGDVGEIIDDAMANRRWGRQAPRDTLALYRAGLEAYERETKPIYEAVIAEMIFGRAAKVFLKHRATGAL